MVKKQPEKGKDPRQPALSGEPSVCNPLYIVSSNFTGVVAIIDKPIYGVSVHEKVAVPPRIYKYWKRTATPVYGYNDRVVAHDVVISEEPDKLPKYVLEWLFGSDKAGKKRKDIERLIYAPGPW